MAEYLYLYELSMLINWQQLLMVLVLFSLLIVEIPVIRNKK